MQAVTNVFPAKPHFMTEYGYSNMLDTACLIHDCLTVEQVAGFNYWSLIWPVGGDALVQIENPYNLSSWTNAPPGTATQSHGWWLTPNYWAMKHFSYFVNPGFKRVSAKDTDANVRCSAFLSPDGLRLVVVLITTNATVSSTMSFNFGAFNVGHSSVYQTAGSSTFPVARRVDRRAGAPGGVADNGCAGPKRVRRFVPPTRRPMGQRRCRPEFAVGMECREQCCCARFIFWQRFKSRGASHPGFTPIHGDGFRTTASIQP